MEQSDLPRLLVLMNCQNDFATPEFPYYKKEPTDKHRRDIMKHLDEYYYDDIVVIIDMHNKEECVKGQPRHCVFNSEGAMIFTPLLQYLKSNFTSRAFIKNEIRHLSKNNLLKSHVLKFNPKITTIDYIGFEHFKNEFNDVQEYFRSMGFKTDKKKIMNVNNK